MKRTIYKKLRNLDDAVKEEIMDKTLHVVSKNFFLKEDFDELSKIINVPKKEIEKRFLNINELIESIVERGSSVTNESTLGIESTGLSPKKKLKLLTDTIVNGMNKNKELVEEFILITKLQVENNNTRIVEQYCGVPIFCVAKIIEDGQKNGEFVEGNPESLSKLFWSYIQGIAILILRSNGKYRVGDTKMVYGFLLA